MILGMQFMGVPLIPFSNLKPEQFRKEENIPQVINSINTTLGSAVPNYNSEV